MRRDTRDRSAKAERVLVIAIVVTAIGLVGAQQGPASVYTAAQATAGRTVYQASCASCHLPDLAGRNEAPQLAGNNFMNAWRTRTTRDLFEFIQSTMPPTGENLSAEQYLGVTAYILQANGAPAGGQPLTPTTSTPIGQLGVRPATTTAGDPLPPPVAGGPPTPAGGRGGRGAPPANAGPIGVTVSGTVKNYVPVTDEMLRSQDPGDWLMARRNYQGWSHSPLTQITRDNAKDLQLVWTWAMNEGQGNEPSPLIHNGIL